MLTAISITAVGLLASLIGTPFVRALARKIDLVDRPDGHRKLHLHAIPLGGGLAVLLGVVAAVGFVLLVPSLRAPFAWPPSFLSGLAAAAVTLCIVGLVDDRVCLRGRQKLLGQCLAAGMLIGSGMLIERVEVFGWNVELGLLAIPFTMFWLLGAINALNLLDGVDGLATSVGIVLSLAVAGMAWMNGHTADALIALAVVGSLIGFLRYNFPPAKIFLGDAGSMLIGLLLGALAIRSSLKGPATVALAAPTAIWAIPIFDSCMAILRRKLTGRSIYTTDRAHLHHVLLKRGYSDTKTLAFVGLLCILTAASALVSVYLHDEWMAVASIGTILGTLVAARFFGHAECALLCRKLANLLISLIPFQTPPPHSRQLWARMQGTRQWDELWNTLTEYADRFDLHSVQLNVSLPTIQEDFHANWQRNQVANDGELWHTEIPLMSGHLNVGRLKISGTCGESSACVWMSELIAGLKPFEVHMLALLEDESPDATTSELAQRETASSVAVPYSP